MKLFRLLACALLAVATAGPSLAEDIVTNDVVIRLTKSHVSEKLILQMIQESPGRYQLSPAAIASLRQQGVSDAVIAAMRTRMGAAATSTPPAEKPIAPPPARSEWRIVDSRDEITGESKFVAFLAKDVVSNGGKGTVEVTASCPKIALQLKIVYLSKFNPKLGYKMSDGNFLLRKPHVVMRLALDGQAGSAPSVTSDYINEATLWFQRPLTEEEKKDLGSALFGGLASLTSPATPDQVYSAKILKVELPLNNGDLLILEIHPQDPEFQKFGARCKAGEDAASQAEKNERARKQAAKAERISTTRPILATAW